VPQYKLQTSAITDQEKVQNASNNEKVLLTDFHHERDAAVKNYSLVLFVV
jgi:hypothetical protein